METPAVQQKITGSPEIEDWDEADFDGLDDVHFRTASTATSIVSHPQTNHRDSTSSRLSMRSDSNHGDENWDVLVDDQAPIKDAVALARSKGIPLPNNIPRSALEGGTIRRLRGKEIKKAIADDWSEDLDFTDAPQQLKLAKAEDRDLSESLRQISAAFHASPKSPESTDGFDTVRSIKSRPAPTPLSLDKFKDEDHDDDDAFGDVPTIKVAKHRSPHRSSLSLSPTATRLPKTMEDIEEDLELPVDGRLRLSTKKFSPRTPQMGDDFDVEWAEGSLGTRRAGTRRGVLSNRSSSVSALSPSVSSAFTAESEDEGLDGLVLPSGPLKFDEILKRKQDVHSPEPPKQTMEKHSPKRSNKNDEDMLEGLVVPDGDVFDSAKLTLNRNIKQRAQRPLSPGKRTTTTLSFTSKQQQQHHGTASRLPRFQADRTRSNLEPVSESGVAVQRYQRPGSRLGHMASASVSSLPSTNDVAPSTPSRRGLRNAESRPDIRYEPTTTNAQLLRAKRSMPMIRGLHSPTKQTSYPRPPSRQDGSSSRMNTTRPKTPTDRADSRLGLNKVASAPFLPAGASRVQSQHASTKATSSRHPRRHDSDGSGESMTAAQRSLSRLAGFRPETPGRPKQGSTAAELAAQAKKTITKPSRRRNFGDGSELEIFDDLPTSATAESRFVKQPIGRGAPKSIRNKLGQGQVSGANIMAARSGAETPIPITPSTPQKSEFPSITAASGANVPRFARDTAASRIAREQRQISTTFQNVRGEPLQPISANWKSTAPIRTTGSIRVKKKNVQQKPHLIKPLGGDMNRPKEVQGMSYNPVLFRWEGNENALAPFDVPEFNPRGHSPVLQAGKANAVMGSSSPNNKSNMALIMNVGGSTSGVQVVGGMVFDPRQMKWLKVAEGGDRDGLRGGSGSVQIEEEEDVFAGLEDLQEEDNESIAAGRLSDRHISTTDVFVDEPVAQPNPEDVGNQSGHSSDEWGVAEEFDVGPEFVRRQRSEEERWKRKVEKWLRSDEEITAEDVEGPAGWRWAIREIVCGGLEKQTQVS